MKRKDHPIQVIHEFLKSTKSLLVGDRSESVEGIYALSEPDDIRPLLEAVGVGRLPQDVELLFRSHNGVDLGDFWYALAADDAVELLEDFLEQGDIVNDISLGVDGAWPRNWVPFLSWNADTYGVVCCNSDKAGKILGYSRASGKLVPWAENLAGFFERAVSLFESDGEVNIDLLMGRQ
ncbi:MAG: SMI1/KNR4 family protein [Pseudomonadota bacterium]